jgi:hypothetical protein
VSARAFGRARPGGGAAPLALAVVGVILLGVLAPACARRAPGPADTLAAYGAAVERRDDAAAYALTSDGFRARVPLAAFRAELDAGGDETRALGKQLRTDAARHPPRVELELDLGETVSLVEEGGRFRVDGAPLDPWSQKTPRAALRTFIRALERGRYDIVLRLCPARRRAGLTAGALREAWEGARKEQNAQLLARLRAAIRTPIVELGDEARLPYGEHDELRFVREDALWKIEDPD